MSALKAVIPPSDNVTLNINGHSLPGFKRGETWNGLVKYTKGQNYVILEDVNPQPEDGFNVIKMNPALADKVNTPPTADESDKTNTSGESSATGGQNNEAAAAGASSVTA